MNESVFKEILGDALSCELAEYDNAIEHKFSLKHRMAMKFIFAKYARNVRKLKKEEESKDAAASEYKPRLNLRQRLIVALLIIILMSFLVGWIVVFFSEKFHGTVYHDNTQLIAVDVENCPDTIEHKYVLASVPEGFEIIETDSSPVDIYTRYKNKQTGQGITFSQWIKTAYKPHVNTEHYQIEEIVINGKNGLYIDFSDKKSNKTFLVWDNGDYTFEVSADLTKSEVLNLVEFNKI